MAKNKVTFLRPELADEGRAYINRFLGETYKPFDQVYLCLCALREHGGRVVVDTYNGQAQVTAFFEDEKGSYNVAVGGLGKELDLAILSCYAKCALVLQWNFAPENEANSPAGFPDFS